MHCLVGLRSMYGWPFLDLVFDAPGQQGIRTGDGMAEEQPGFHAGLLAQPSAVLLRRDACVGEGCGLLADS